MSQIYISADVFPVFLSRGITWRSHCDCLTASGCSSHIPSVSAQRCRWGDPLLFKYCWDKYISSRCAAQRFNIYTPSDGITAMSLVTMRHRTELCEIIDRSVCCALHTRDSFVIDGSLHLSAPFAAFSSPPTATLPFHNRHFVLCISLFCLFICSVLFCLCVCMCFRFHI